MVLLSTLQMWPDLISKDNQGREDVIESYMFWNAHKPQSREVCGVLLFDKMYMYTHRHMYVRAYMKVCMDIHIYVGAYVNYGIDD